MHVEILLPERRMVSVEELATCLERSRTAPPFDPSVVNACTDLSQRIMRDREARSFPELLALAFWIRKAEIHRLSAEFSRLHRPDRVLMPRGTVFHLPPRNVDTMFVYSWLLSALTGNLNVIRLSPLRSQSTNVLLRLFGEALAAAEEPARSGTLVVSYGHDEAPTTAFTSLCDVRVIWGGDQTVASIRRVALPPHARELTFPDRFSISAIGTRVYLRQSEEERDALADRFFNDSFWFDQMACSSPRLVVWCGDLAGTASEDFFPRVAACARRRGYALSPGLSMQNLVFSASAILERPVGAYRRFPELTVLTLDTVEGLNREHDGGGLFLEVHVESLRELAPALVRKDQTLTHFGLEEGELRELIESLNGRAIDRIVPVGQALQFGRFWDGQDLLQEFCRHVYLEMPRKQSRD